MHLKVIIGADIVPTKSNYDLFRTGNREKLIGEDLCNLLDDADYMILNLETPLTDHENPIVKCGPNLIAPTDTIVGLKSINPYFFTLANNHIMDQGEEGLFSTLSVLDRNNISYAGVGRNLQEASKPYVVEIKGIKLGIYCCAEHEFSIATENSCGANPYDPLYSFDHIKELKENSDFVIVLYHGGKEEYRYPTPELQKVFHKFAEVGADCVIAQHTHCIGCVEEYLGSILVYGQGNFLFDHSESDYWQTSMLVELIINKERNQFKFIPLRKQRNTVLMADNNTANEIMENMKARSEQILLPSFIQNNYQKLADDLRKNYYIRLSGRIGQLFPVRVLNKITKYRFLEYLYNDHCLPSIENCFECETHRELVAQVCKKYMVK